MYVVRLAFEATEATFDVVLTTLAILLADVAAFTPALPIGINENASVTKPVMPAPTSPSLKDSTVPQSGTIALPTSINISFVVVILR